MKARLLHWLRPAPLPGGERVCVIPTRHGWLHKLGWAFGLSEFS